MIMKLNLTRRSFLKRSSLAAAAFSLADTSSPSFVSSELQEYRDKNNLQRVPTVCAMCRARCLVQGLVAEGRLLRIQGNSENLFNGDKVCARGLAAVKLLYDPDRLKYPLKRSGRRGEGKWARISWEEAITIIGQKVKEILAQSGPEGLALMSGGPSSWYIRKLFQEMGVTQIQDASYHYCDSVRNIAYKSVFGESPGDPLRLDYRNTQCIVLIGSHLGENVQVPEIKEFVEALDRGAQLIVVDPRHSSAANKADYYLPIKPGTDTALIMGWINHIIDNELYNEEWIREKVEGFEELREHVSQYSLERVATITDLTIEQIKATANVLAYHAPATMIHPGGHLSWYGNDVERVRSMAILAALLGSGSWGSVGGIIPGKKEYGKLESLQLSPGNAAFSSIRNKILKGSIKAVGCWGQNSLQSHPLPYKTIEAFEKADFVFTCDVLPTESSLYADIVLPEATFLERYDRLEVWPDAEQPVVATRFPVVTPLFESRDPYWIVQQLSKMIGKGKAYFKHADAGSFLDHQLKSFGSSLGKLKENNGFARLPGNIDSKRDDLTLDEADDRTSFSTPSTKIEFFSKIFQDNGWSPMPEFDPPEEPPNGFFRLLYGRSPAHTLSQTCNNSWLLHEVPENELWVNDVVARGLQLKDGDNVILENQDRIRSINSIKVKVTPGIRRDCVYTVHGFGARAPMLSLGFARGVSDTYLMTRSKRDPISAARGQRVNFVRLVKKG